MFFLLSQYDEGSFQLYLAHVYLTDVKEARLQTITI